MFKQMSIFLLGILFFIVTIQSEQLPNDTNDEPGLGSVSNDVSINKMIKLINRRDIFNLDHMLKRNTRDANDDRQHFRQQILKAHNRCRSRHCAPPLTLDDDLNRSAQEYAEHLVVIDKLEHSDDRKDVGENLWMYWSSEEISNDNVGADATDSWYNEVKQYNYARGGFSPVTAHFTQLVWKKSKKIGAGIAYNNDRTKVYVVARYSPAGNSGRTYKANVLPPRC